MDGDQATGSAEPHQAFGRWLKQERELRDMTPDEIAASTKLGLPVIEALESGEAARLPPHAYLVGYLRAYAAALGMDADEVVLRWQEVAGEPPVPARRPRRLLLPVLLAAAVLGVAAAMLLGALLR
jgi:cytoskeletal protein RodZ